MTDTLLRVQGLKTYFGSGASTVRAVDDISFDIRQGETFALLGESGCGKSMTSLSIMRLVPQPAGRIEGGSVLLRGQDLLALPEVAMRKVRGGRIAMIFQEPMTSLNPVMTIGNQIRESLTLHKDLQGAAADRRVVELLDAVGIPDPQRRMQEYPHQLSGGMKQRVMIAMALAGEPELLIADEPTTALDVTIQAQVLDLLKKLQQDSGMSVLLITHDLGVVSGMADRVAVMYAGQIVEQASRDEFFKEPKHPYSRKLFESLPDMNKREQQLAVMRGSVPSLAQEFSGCRFEPRCDFAWSRCAEQVPAWVEVKDHGARCHLLAGDAPLTSNTPKPAEAELADLRPRRQVDEALTVNDLAVHFPIHRGLFKRVVGHVKAVDGVSLVIPPGKTVALVGESGCGKTTVAKGVLQLIRPSAGAVQFGALDLMQLKGETLRQHRRDMQIIFQDPFSSMNPRMLVRSIIEEGMVAQDLGGSAQERERRVDELLRQVGLSPESKYRYPHEFSGGQRQRICIARALAVDPKLIICDEPTSALDVSVQAQILNLLKKLQERLGISYLFITHNISVVEYLAHEVAVMYLGRIVEQGEVRQVLNDPKHPYTRALLSAVPSIDEKSGREVVYLQGELPSPSNPPQGCHFHPRCAQAQDKCRGTYPEFVNLSDKQKVRCFLY